MTDFRPSMERRTRATERLIAALAHLTRDQAVAVVASFIPLDELEDLAKFQERRN